MQRRQNPIVELKCPVNKFIYEALNSQRKFVLKLALI